MYFVIDAAGLFLSLYVYIFFLFEAYINQNEIVGGRRYSNIPSPQPRSATMPPIGNFEKNIIRFDILI